MMGRWKKGREQGEVGGRETETARWVRTGMAPTEEPLRKGKKKKKKEGILPKGAKRITLKALILEIH